MTTEPDDGHRGIVCARLGEPAVPGSIVETCERCLAKISLSPDGQRFRDTHDVVHLICHKCHGELHAADPEAHQLGDVMPGVSKTIADMFGLNEALVAVHLQKTIDEINKIKSKGERT